MQELRDWYVAFAGSCRFWSRDLSTNLVHPQRGPGVRRHLSTGANSAGGSYGNPHLRRSAVLRKALPQDPISSHLPEK